MNMMAEYPSGYFDLAVADPPYGIGQDWKKRRSRKQYVETNYKNDAKPGMEYFNELRRVSKNQIIFGYNYFTDVLGPTNYLLVWDKMANKNIVKYSQGELLYTSIHIPLQIISVMWDGCKMGDETGAKKIHPHQRPVALYKTILQKYAKMNDKIIDTHLGSGSIALACVDMGFDLTACEIDGVYFNAALKRIYEHTRQQEFPQLTPRYPVIPECQGLLPRHPRA
jgi:site-specific DNA-methyltransferase (adenine-specific)